jgi:signal peptidase I
LRRHSAKTKEALNLPDDKNEFPPPGFLSPEELFSGLKGNSPPAPTPPPIPAPMQVHNFPQELPKVAQEPLPKPPTPEELFASLEAKAGQDLSAKTAYRPPASAPPRPDPAKPAELTQPISHDRAKPDTLLKKALSVAGNLIFWAFCIALVVGSALFAVSGDPDKNYFGYRTYNVLTQSMTPTVQADGTTPPGGFKKGALIIVKICEPRDIKVGDIVTFNPNPNDPANSSFLTHRVVGIKDELGGKPGIYFVTKGDHNQDSDPPISGNMVIGKKVFSIPAAGGILQKIREHFALALVCILCFFAALIMFRWYFAKPKEEDEPPKISNRPYTLTL